MRKIVLLLASMVASLVLASGVAFIAVERNAQATFPGANGKIAFIKGYGSKAELYTVSPSGDNLKRLTHNSKEESQPSFSADGGRIVFRSANRLYTIHTDGSNLTKVPNGSGNYEPAFSPSGKKLVFARCDSIYTMNIDGSNMKRFSGEGCSVYYEDRDFADSRPEWSPDGKKIAFERLGGLPWTNRIYIKRVSDRATVQVIEPADAVEAFYYPNFSPDGSQIAYLCVCLEEPNTSDYNSDVHRVNIGGSGDTRLTTDPAYDTQPAFSPNGDKIVFSSDRDGDLDLYVMNTDGGGRVRQLTNDRAADEAPAWQPVP